ncbi:MAG: hypothetical protein ACO1NZ_07450 [Adhaeribacter sp.]
MALYFKLLKVLALIGVLLYVMRLLISLLSKEKSLYAPDPGRHFFMLFWALLCLLVAGPLFVIYFAKPQVEPLEATLLLMLGLLLASFSLPVFVLHIQYFIYDFQKLVEIDKKGQTFKIYDVAKKLYYRQEDIVTATRVRCQTARFFWSNYEYITFEFRTGQQITITSLLMPLDKITRYIPARNLVVQHRNFCFI